MKDSIHLSLKPLFIFIFFLVFSSTFPSSRGKDEDEKFRECGRPYECGEIRNLSYPFWGNNRPWYCGHPGFNVSCPENNRSVIKINDVEFQLLSLDVNHSARINTIRIARLDLLEGPCSPKVKNVNSTLSSQYDLFIHYPSTIENLTLYYCNPSEVYIDQSLISLLPSNFSCSESVTVFYTNDSLWDWNFGPFSCYRVIQVPILRDSLGESTSHGEDGLKVVSEALNRGFDVVYPQIISCTTCEESGGKCGGYNNTSFQYFRCFCPYGEELVSCTRSGNIDGRKLKALIGAAIAGITILLICITIFCSRKMTSICFWKNITQEDQNIEAFIRNYIHQAVKRYKFLDIKKMTESFKDKLGKGGYGEVYKGKLLDKRLVAVKLLNTSKGNGQEFVNEVASISRTSHVNIVSLLGFCLEGGKRALIYEFMPNGSLEKFIYNDCNLQSSIHLEWEKMLQIAIGIARGLEYLHRGCNTRILHFDIKPHNVLLDENLCPKISDFGLAKLCLKKESIVSLLDARGTIGYMAPEVLSRNFGGVSSKSDVYSYGMMILEMVGGRKNIKVGVSQTSEIYFPDWIYKHLQQESNLRLWGEMTSEENEIAKKMVLVGLWCIQTMPSDRPSMSKVIEMLEGSLEALRLPPKPSMFAPGSPEILPIEPAAESSTASVL